MEILFDDNTPSAVTLSLKTFIPSCKLLYYDVIKGDKKEEKIVSHSMGICIMKSIETEGFSLNVSLKH